MRAGLFLALFLFVLILPVHALKETTIYMPAVEETDYGQSGVMATLTVNVKEGSGHVYVDTWPLAKIDTQASARIARDVACNSLYIDCSRYDFFYTIRSDAEIVGGPSGGAAMAIATLASLLDLEINNHVLITGTINPDGSIGPIGGIIEKAQASSEKGSIFLIPDGQNLVKTDKGDVDIKKYAKDNWNLTVTQVKDIKEAFSYFTNYVLKEKTMQFVKTEQYQTVMKGFGLELINHSKELQNVCIDNAKISKIDYLSKEQIMDLCNQTLDDAKASFDDKTYYSAASLAFSTSISYQYGIKLSGFLNSSDKKEFAKTYLDSLGAEKLEINTTNIELYAIIEERYSDALDNIDLGWKDYYEGNYSKAVYDGAYAEERLYTAKLWNQHSEDFPLYIKTTSDQLSLVSNNAISDAYSVFTYTNLVAPGTLSFEAGSLIDKAREKHKKGTYYTAIILALKAKSDAEIACEVAGKTNYDYILSLHKKSALIAINSTNSIIGQSYFEYGQTLEKTNKMSALMYYTYAEKMSKLNDLVNQKVISPSIEPTEYIEPLKYDYINSPFLSSYISSFLSYWFFI
jgi:uncharacterized protein